ncbi:hypothetical protein [Rhodoferax fermentans]|uniref:hypothetical protein n=1 Tax=Rhodoferax fermentans TaxID=28066 RepID=UPI00117AF9B4|nr:hypothetical protein [Rhodoferax fermentans]
MYNGSPARRFLSNFGWITKKYYLLLWLILAVIILYYFIEVFNGGNEWKTGDWLINYQAGIVRRGLLGQILYTVSNFGVSLKWLTFSIQTIIYTSVYRLIINIFLLRPRNLTWYVFLFSPAFLIFSFLDFKSGFRKEILIFLAFALLSYYYALRNLNKKVIILTYLTFLISTFSHESTALALPFFIYIFFSAKNAGLIKSQLALLYSIIFSATAFAALMFAISYPGDEGTATGICKSLLLRNFKEIICTGSIEWLRFDAQYGWTKVVELGKRSIFIYFSLFSIAIAPVFLTNWANKQKLYFLCCAFAFFLPLYFVGVDWGRWIYIYIFFVFTLILSDSVLFEIEIKSISRLYIFMYLTTWSIPNSYASRISFGWLERFWLVLHQIKMPSFLF